MTIYSGEPWLAGEFPGILAIGDSWFWYPNNNILEAIAAHPRLKPDYRHMQMLGFNGARLDEYVHGKYAAAFQRELRPENLQYYSAFMISGAGNDAVDYGLALRDDCRNLSTPESCMDEDRFDSFLRGISRDMGSLIHDILWEVAKQNRLVDIFIHGYDYPLPDGRGFGPMAEITIAGPWLKPAMDRARVDTDPQLRLGICRLLMTGLDRVFRPFHNPVNRVHYVDSRGTLSSIEGDYRDDWANELHPTRKGFDRIVDRKWIPVLASAGYAI